MEPSRVRVATCSNTAEAAMVRGFLDAHDIDVVIAGEHNASMLVGLAGSYVALDVYVDRRDAERASELIRSLREGADPSELPDDGDDEVDPEGALETRKRTGVVVVLALCITFGTAHLYTRAWMRGITLAAVELVGIGQIGDNRILGAALILGAIVLDLVGALIRVRRPHAPGRAPLPTARLRN